MSTSKPGGASLSGASSSGPVYADGNQGPEKGRHLLKATEHRTSRAGATTGLPKPAPNVVPTVPPRCWSVHGAWNEQGRVG